MAKKISKAEELIKSKKFADVIRRDSTFGDHYVLANKDLEFRLTQIQRQIGCGKEEAMIVMYEAVLAFLKRHGIPLV